MSHGEGNQSRPSYARNVTGAHAATKLKADNAAIAVLPVVDGLRDKGVTSLNELARRLNELGYRGPRGGAWTATAVKRALARIR